MKRLRRFSLGYFGKLNCMVLMRSSSQRSRRFQDYCISCTRLSKGKLQLKLGSTLEEELIKRVCQFINNIRGVKQG